MRAKPLPALDEVVPLAAADGRAWQAVALEPAHGRLADAQLDAELLTCEVAQSVLPFWLSLGAGISIAPRSA